MSDPNLLQFLEAAGRSLSGAQGALTARSGLDTTLAIADAELEVKTTIQSTPEGFTMAPVTSADARQGALVAAALSTVKVRFVALADQAPATPAVKPQLTADQVRDQVASQPDLVGLRDVFGQVQVQPVFVPESQRWLVTVTEPAGRVLREVVVPDQLRPEEA